MHFSSVDAQNLRLMAFDVDGVMTDGRLLFGPQGEELKVFNTLDGHGLKKLAASGVTLAIITGRNSPMVAKRAADLGIEHVIQGREDKGVALEALAEPTDPLFYVGGSPSMAWAVFDDLIAEGVPAKNIHSDVFDYAPR